MLFALGIIAGLLLSTFAVIVESRLAPEKRPIEYLKKKSVENMQVEIIEPETEASADFLSSIPSEDELPEQLRDEESDI